MTIERRRTQVLLKVVRLPLSVAVRNYLDSYHAYIENVPEGLSKTYKEAIKIGMTGDLSFTVVHQEGRPEFSIFQENHTHNNLLVSLKIDSHAEMIEMGSRPCSRVTLPID